MILGFAKKDRGKRGRGKKGVGVFVMELDERVVFAEGFVPLPCSTSETGRKEKKRKGFESRRGEGACVRY